MPWECWALLGSCWAARWGAPRWATGESSLGKLCPQHSTSWQLKGGRPGASKVSGYVPPYLCLSLIFWFPSFILVPINNAGRYVSPRYLDRTRRKKKRACRKQLCWSYTPCPVPKIACVQVGAVFDGSLAGLCNSGTRYHFYVRTEKIGTGVRVRMYSAHCVAVPISSVDCVYCSRWV